MAAIRWHRAQGVDPFKLKIKQAANYRWQRDAAVARDGEAAPFTRRCVRFIRGREEAVLWHRDLKITLVRLNLPFDFDDFGELEEFIATHPREADLDDAAGELKYLREMELFFVRHGFRDEMMHLQATDYEFLVTYGKLFKAGYAANVESLVVAAFVLNAVQFYEQDRKRTMRWLTETTKDFARAEPGRLA